MARDPVKLSPSQKEGWIVGTFAGGRAEAGWDWTYSTESTAPGAEEHHTSYHTAKQHVSVHVDM